MNTQIILPSAYKPEFFITQEFVSKYFYELKGEKALRYIDIRMLITADQLRRTFGKTTINNWAFGGERQYSGLRRPHDPHYKIGSDHSWGRALDCIFEDYTAEEVRSYIEKHPEKFPYVTFVEEGKNITWLHVGCPNLCGFNPQSENSIIFWDADTGETREVVRG